MRILSKLKEILIWKLKICKLKINLVNNKYCKFYSKRKSKRQVSVSSSFSIDQNINYLNVEYLVVLDKSALDFFISVYGNIDDDLMNLYINIFFIHIVNGVGFNQIIKNY
jgi:hypothetical protein